MKTIIALNEFCNHCGKDVAWGFGNYSNRVPDCNDIATRIESNLDFPLGDFVCAECDNERTDNNE